MTRQKIQIKKIDSASARQVTFCKRRRGLFKKANELSTLCDAEIALMVFSTTGKLFEYSSSSLKQVIERHNSHLVNLNKFDQPSLDLQLESSTYAILSKEIAEKTHELRLNIQLFQREFLADFHNRYLEVSLQMRGEELQGLNMEELRKLEKLVEGGLNCVTETKGERILKEISALKKQEAILIEENLRLKQLKQMANTSMNHTHVLEHGQLSESITNLCSSADPPQDYDSSDTSLKLGLRWRCI